MTLFANQSFSGRADMIGAVRALQQYMGRPVSAFIDDQSIGQQIVVLQKYVATLPSPTAPSGFLLDPALVRSNIADHTLPAAIIQLQTLVYESYSEPAGEQFITITGADGVEQPVTAADNNRFDRRLTIATGLN